MLAKELQDQYESMAPAEKQKVAAYVVASLPPVTNAKTISNLWYLVVGTFTVLLLGGAAAVFALTWGGKDTKDLLPLVTASLGVLAGLLAPSPVQKSNG